MEVEAHVYYWTPDGMRTRPFYNDSSGYIEVAEVKRLLEDNDRRIRQQMSDEFNQRLGSR